MYLDSPTWNEFGNLKIPKKRSRDEHSLTENLDSNKVNTSWIYLQKNVEDLVEITRASFFLKKSSSITSIEMKADKCQGRNTTKAKRKRKQKRPGGVNPIKI